MNAVHLMIEMSRIVILVDNKKLDPQLRSTWGFSAYVEYNNYRGLVDVGPDYNALVYNAKLLGINLHNLDFIAITHWHGDHSGALDLLLTKMVSNISLLIFPSKYGAISSRAEVIIPSGFSEILPDIYTTGPLSRSFLVEQSIILAKKGILVVGCSHPGIPKILTALDEHNIKVRTIIGGFHMFGSSKTAKKRVLDSLESHGVETVVPCHCSGKDFVEFLHEYFNGKIVDCGTGLIYNI